MGCKFSKCCGCCIAPGSVLYDADDDAIIQPCPSKQLDHPAKIPCMGNTLHSFPTGMFGTSGSVEDDCDDDVGNSLSHAGALPCFPAQSGGQGLTCFGGSAAATMLRVAAHMRAKGFPMAMPTGDTPGAAPVRGSDTNNSIQHARLASDISSIYDAVSRARNTTLNNDAESDISDLATFASLPTSNVALGRDSFDRMLPLHAGHVEGMPVSPTAQHIQLNRLSQQSTSSVPYSQTQYYGADTTALQHRHFPHHSSSTDHPAVEAFKRGSLAFAFSGGGFFCELLQFFADGYSDLAPQHGI